VVRYTTGGSRGVGKILGRKIKGGGGGKKVVIKPWGIVVHKGKKAGAKTQINYSYKKKGVGVKGKKMD